MTDSSGVSRGRSAPTEVIDRLDPYNACLACSLSRKRCEVEGGSTLEVCRRCLASNLPCVTQDPSFNKKKRDRLKAAFIRATKGKSSIGTNFLVRFSSQDLLASTAKRTRARPVREEDAEEEDDNSADLKVDQRQDVVTIAGSLSATSTKLPIGGLDLELGQDLPLFDNPSFLPLGDVPNYVADCLTSFFVGTNIALPILHRETFEKALSGPSVIYGPQKPLALMFTAALCGTQHAHLGLTDQSERRALVRALFEHAKAILLAGYIDARTASGRRPIGHLEASQALLLLYQWSVMEVGGHHGLPLLKCSHEALQKVVSAQDGSFLGALTQPSNAIEWVRLEMARRLFLVCIAHDSGASYFVRKPFYVDCFQHPIPLPAHESFFNSMRANDAFAILCEEPFQFLPPILDLRPLLADFTNAEIMRTVAHDTITAMFSFRCSILGIAALNAVARRVRTSLRSLADKNNIDLIALASRTDLAADSLPEVVYRRGVFAIEAMATGLCRAMPGHLGGALEEGDPRPLLAHASSYFAEQGHAETLLSTILMIKSLAIENWVDPDLSGSSSSLLDAQFFASAPMADILISSCVLARLMEGLLEADPQLLYNTHAAFIGALRVGCLDLAAISVFRVLGDGMKTSTAEVLAGMEHDARVVLRYLESLGKLFSYSRRVASDFRKVLVDSGLTVVVPAVSITYPGQPKTSSGSFVFVATVNLMDKWVRHGIESSGEM